MWLLHEKEFFNPLLKQGFYIITKTLSEANLVYVFKGKQKAGRRIKKQYDGKINTACIDKPRLVCCNSDEQIKAYAGIVYCVLLKQRVLAAFIY